MTAVADAGHQRSTRPARRLRLVALVAVVGPRPARRPLRRRPGRASPPTRCSAPTTATSCSGCSCSSTVALIALPRPRRPHGRRHRAGSDRAGPRALRRARRRRWRLAALVVANVGTTCAEFAGIAAGFELFGVSRYVSVPLAAVGVSPAGAARQLPPRRARAAGARRRLRRLRRRRRRWPHPDWGAAAARPGRARRCRGPATRSLIVDGDRRHHARAVGAELHPVVRGRQAADGRRPALRAGRRGHRRGAHRRHRVLRRGRLRGHPARQRASRSTTPPTRRGALEPLAGDLAATLFAHRAHRRRAARRRRSCRCPPPTRCASSSARRPPLDDSLRRGAAVLRDLRRRSPSSPRCVVLVPGVPLVPILVLTQVAQRRPAAAAAGADVRHRPRRHADGRASGARGVERGVRRHHRPGGRRAWARGGADVRVTGEWARHSKDSGALPRASGATCQAEPGLVRGVIRLTIGFPG